MRNKVDRFCGDVKIYPAMVMSSWVRRVFCLGTFVCGEVELGGEESV
jgi:hypothetical protein